MYNPYQSLRSLKTIFLTWFKSFTKQVMDQTTVYKYDDFIFQIQYSFLNEKWLKCVFISMPIEANVIFHCWRPINLVGSLEVSMLG